MPASLSPTYAEQDRIDPWATTAAILGIGAVAGLAYYWWLGETPKLKNPLGHILCPVTPYDGPVDVGDYVVVQLRDNKRTISEPTWAEVIGMHSGGRELKIRIAGESSEQGKLAKPLQTAKHGFKIGDETTIPASCIYDRYQQGQSWTVLCGPRLAGTGYTAVAKSEATKLGLGDDAQVLVRDSAGVEGLWLRIDQISAGQQTLSGTVLYPTSLADVHQGDVIDFLRDCVVDMQLR